MAGEARAHAIGIRGSTAGTTDGSDARPNKVRLPIRIKLAIALAVPLVAMGLVTLAEVVSLFGSPVKFDVALPLSGIAAFATDSAALIARHAPAAVPVLFGHVGEGNLHLNVLRCDGEQEATIYPAMMELIAAHGGNVSSEHGVGSRKRAYLAMSRQPADIAVMRIIKNALDPTGYLNPAVLFD